MEQPICSIPNCGRIPSARGWCGLHYQRWVRHRDPLAGRPRRTSAGDQATCPGCGEDFIAESLRQKWCSRRCQNRVWIRRRKGIEDPGFKRQCWWCHKTFEFLDGRRYYCSDECAKIGSLLYNLERNYGITRDDYRAAYFRQNGLCAICKQPERTERNTLLCVDHDHVTGQFRGLLCSHCNRAIGLLLDDPKVIEAAARYVKENRQMKLVIV